MKKYICLLSALIITVSGCSFFGDSNKDDSGLVAKVNDRKLTVNDLLSRVPAEYSNYLTKEQNVIYSKRWIEDELLAAEARKLGIDKEPEIKKAIHRAVKEILVGEMKDRILNKETPVPEEEISKYYEENKDEFVISVPRVKFAHIRLKKDIWDIRNLISDNNFFSIASRYSLDPVPDTSMIKFVTEEDVPPHISQVVFNIREGGTSRPIKTNNGHLIVRVLEKQKPGTLRSIEEVKPEIIYKIREINNRRFIQDTIDKLRLRSNIEFIIENIPGPADTSVKEPQQ
ncbi:MAG: peptidyl-prolyl cis-trans isomerase [Fibrobacterota bacterium]